MKDISTKELQISFDECFHVMDDEEKSTLNFYDSTPAICIKDPDRHIILCIASKTHNSVISWLMSDTFDGAKQMAKQLKKVMAAYHYGQDENVTYTFDGITGNGFKYHYQTAGQNMNGLSYIVKKEKTFYYIHAYYRPELKQESEDVIDQILASIRWI